MDSLEAISAASSWQPSRALISQGMAVQFPHSFKFASAASQASTLRDETHQAFGDHETDAATTAGDCRVLATLPRRSPRGLV